MRFGTFTAIVAVAAAATEACSLLLPYDEYPGTLSVLPEDDAGRGEAGPNPVPTPTVDAGPAVVIDGGGGADACAGIDLATDSNNCGACARRCVTGSCAGGKCPIETLTPAGVSRVMSLDLAPSDVGDKLYFTRASGALGRLAPDGGGVETSPTNKAIGPTFLSGNGKSGVFGGDASVWTFRTAAFTTDAPARIVNRPALGPVLLAGSLAYFGDDKGLWWAEPKADATINGVMGSRPLALAAFGGRVYWAAANGDVLSMRAANPENPAVIVSTGRAGVSSIAVTTANLYLGHPSQGLVIYDLDNATLTASRPRIVSLDDVEAIASDDAHVYVLDFPGNRTTGRLLRMNLDGQALTLLANALTPSYALAVDGDHVYFASGGQIQRTSK